MDKETLIRILREWNFWDRNVGKYVGIRRDASEVLIKFLEEPEIITLSGPRRAGKSTAMYQLVEHILATHSPAQVLFVNFEEPAFIPHLSVQFLERIYETYREKINPDRKAYVFLDEVQNINGWEKWVRSYYDKKENVKFVISGSSSKLLSSEFSTLLTGRQVNFEMFPLSFREFLRFRAEYPKEETKETERKVKYLLAEYMRFGGFPEMALKKDNEVKTKTLEQYFESSIAKDVLERYGIRDVVSLRQAAVFALTNISKEFSFNTLHKTLGISADSAREYVSHLESAYLLSQLPYFAYSLKESMARNRKMYAVDVGLRNAVSKSFSEDAGRVAENMVFCSLRAAIRDVHYWKGRKEVDFVFRRGTRLAALNVVYSDQVPEREIDGLKEFAGQHKDADLILITKDVELEKDGIMYVPLWKWLLTFP